MMAVALERFYNICKPGEYLKRTGVHLRHHRVLFGVQHYQVLWVWDSYVSHSRWCHREDVIKMMSHIFPVRSSWMTDIDIDWENVRKLFDFLKKKKESVGRSVKQLEQFPRSSSNYFSPLLHFRITMTMNKMSLARSRMCFIKRWDWDYMFTFKSNPRTIRPWSSSVWHHVSLV